MDVEIRVNGKAFAQGRGPRSAPLTFTANGRDSYSPVSLADFERKPFAYNGRIEWLDVKYLK